MLSRKTVPQCLSTPTIVDNCEVINSYSRDADVSEDIDEDFVSNQAIAKYHSSATSKDISQEL